MAETFGETTKLPSEQSWTPNYIVGVKFQSGSAGTLEKLTMYCKYKSANAKVKLAIYDTSFSPLTNGITNEVTITSGIDGDVDFAFATPPEVAATTDYWLCWNSDAAFYQYRDDGAEDQQFYAASPYDTWPDPIIPTYQDYIFTIYATYEEEEVNNAPTAPTALQVDGKSAPTGVNCISSENPQFSAIYNDPDAGDQSNAIQIQVGTASGLSNMWDSGWLADNTIQGNRCTAKTYAGAALSTGTSYWWRCRFRDDDDAIGTWSSWQQFDICAVGPPPPPPGIGLQCIPGGPLPHRRPFACATRMPRKEPSYRFPYEYPLLPGLLGG